MAKSAPTKMTRRESNGFKTPTDLSQKGVAEISASLRHLLADVFALYVKTKNFHWHMTGRAFPRLPSPAGRARGADLRHDRRYRRTRRKSAARPSARSATLPNTSVCTTATRNCWLPKKCWPSSAKTTSSSLASCATHKICDDHNDVATASLIENWIDETDSPHLVPLGNRQRPLIRQRRAPLPKLLIFLVPKLCLGTRFAKLCFAHSERCADRAKQSFADLRARAELGSERAVCLTLRPASLTPLRVRRLSLTQYDACRIPPAHVDDPRKTSDRGGAGTVERPRPADRVDSGKSMKLSAPTRPPATRRR